MNVPSIRAAAQVDAGADILRSAPVRIAGSIGVRNLSIHKIWFQKKRKKHYEVDLAVALDRGAW